MKTNDSSKKTEFISVRISQVTKKKLEKLAKDEDRTLSWLVSKVLDGYVMKK